MIAEDFYILKKWQNMFKRIPGYEWYYDINEEGKIRSYWKIWNRDNKLSDEPQSLIKPRVKKSKSSWEKEFPAVTLYNWIRKQKFYPSRLVAQLFMWYNPTDKTKQIIFIDWNPMNYCKANLYIWSVSERALNCKRKNYLADKINNKWIKKKYEQS